MVMNGKSEKNNGCCGNLDHEMKNLKDDLAQLRDDLSAISAVLLAHGKAEYAAKKDSILNQGKDSYDNFEQMLRAHPVKALLIGFGVGYIISKLGK